MTQCTEFISAQYIFSIFGESLAVAGLLTEPPWLGQETGHSHPGFLICMASPCSGQKQ